MFVKYTGGGIMSTIHLARLVEALKTETEITKIGRAN